jgi:hypothetical protein
MTKRTIGEPARNIDVFGEFDVVVLGGGPAGIAAAAAAGKAGRSTLLVERYGHLGGSGTVAGLSNFCGLHANVHGEMKQVVHGVADDILARLAHMEALNKPHLSLGNKILAQVYDMSAYKIASEEMLADAGVAILYHAFGVGAIMESPERISTLLVETKSGRRAIVGRVFVDASGDADLAAWSGAPFEKGADTRTMAYPSTKFMINGVDPVRAGKAWDLIPQLMDEAERNGQTFPRKSVIVRPARNPVEWRANVTQVRNPDGTPVDGTDADQLSYGETEGRRQSWHVFDFIRKHTPGFENSYISEIFALGIRETRRVVGLYTITERDVLGCASFDDTIGVSGWPVEQHIAGDVRIAFPPIPESRGFHHLPYRMLVSPAVDNLLVAGRCASMSHDGQSAARVSGPCFAMGQAVGTAADIALTGGIAVRDVDVSRLQQRLEADGAYLGRTNDYIADFTPTERLTVV